MADGSVKPAPWPASVPATAPARAMLRGERSPGALEPQRDEFLQGLVGLERAALSSARPPALESALVARFRGTLAAARMPARPDEVDAAGLQALVTELRDEVLAVMAAAQAEAGQVHVVLRQNREALERLAAALQNFAPQAAPPAAPPPSADQLPEALRPAAGTASAAPAREALSLEQKARLLRLAVALGALVVVAGLFHGVRLLQEQSRLEAQRAAEARVPEEVVSGDVTAIFLRDPTPQKVADLEERALREGKRLLKLSGTEFQLVPAAPGTSPAPVPVPAPAPVEADPAPDEPLESDAGTAEGMP